MDAPPGINGMVSVFGRFDLRDSEGESVRLTARSAGTLVAFLALHPRGVTRAETAETLWPDSEPEQARGALRTAVRRVRLTLGEAALIDDDGRLKLSLKTDVSEADWQRRARRRAGDAESAIVAAQLEWAIVRQSLLDGWEDAWIEPLRDDARLVANECGTALARLLEERQEPEAALDVLEGILLTVPHHAEALEHAMRLENALHGRERALARVSEARRSLPHDPAFALPESIRRLERAIRDDACGFLPPPPAFADGHDLSLIGHIFEANLRRGGSAALAALAEEAFSPVPMRHPHRTLDLLRKAIDLTEGTSPERMAVVTAAVQYALYVDDNGAIHELCDGLIASFPPEHPLHNGSLTVKGGAYLAVRDFVEARHFIERAVEGCTTEDRRSIALAQLALLDWHELRFEPAILLLQNALDSLHESTRADRERNQAALLSGLCQLHTCRGDWIKAIDAGLRTLQFTNAASPATVLTLAPLGLSLVCEGKVAEGVARLRSALMETHRERMPHAYAFALDAAAVALVRMNDRALAEAVLDAANTTRRRLAFPRSPAELRLVVIEASLDPETVGSGPLRLQSPATLSEWLGEALERAALELRLKGREQGRPGTGND